MTQGTPTPDGAAQRAARDMTAKLGDKLIAVAAVVGLGFWASALRAGLSALMRVNPWAGNMWIEGSVERAVERVSSELIGIDGEALQRVYEQLWDQLQRGLG